MMKKRPEYDMKETGKNMKQHRKAKGLSAEQVREYMQLGSVQAIYKWERGECFPQADNLLALAFLYGVSPEVLMVQKREDLWYNIVLLQNVLTGNRFFSRMERYYFSIMPMNGMVQLTDAQISGFLRRRLAAIDRDKSILSEDCMILDY